ncbi:MAG: DUF5916 domain-containing protein [Terriglobales bacterium]
MLPRAALAGSAVTPELPALVIPRLEQSPKLDDFEGMEPRTALAHRMLKIASFTQRDPHDGAPASQRTEAYIGYTTKNLYVVFLCFDNNPGQIRAHMNRREDIQSEDQIGFILDTFRDHQHGLTFYVNSLGVQQDGTFTEGSNPDFSWDTVWNSSAHLTGDGYMAWMEIPFRSLRFPRQTVQRWGILFERDIPRNNEASFFPRITSQQQGFLTQEAVIEGFEEVSPGHNMQFNPYGSFRSFHALDDRDADRARYTNRLADMRAGLDSKIVLKDSLVLDTTINPDFAQVESDDPQTTVNQRFEVFFPEKRPFFQENSGYFDTPVNLLFTRRIASPTFGVRLTGKVGPWSIGSLIADDRSPGLVVREYDPLSNRRAYFGVLRVSHDIGHKGSRIGLIYTDRELNSPYGTACTDDPCITSQNRVGGVDGHFQLNKNWYADVQALTSFTKYNDGTHQGGPSYQVYVDRSSRKMEFNSMYQDTAEGFKTLTGFFRRPDIRRFSNFFQYRNYTKGGFLVWHGPSIFTYNTWDHHDLRLEYYANLNYRVQFKRQTNFGVYVNADHERLRPVDYDALPANRDYAHNHHGFWFYTGLTNQIIASAEINWGVETNYDPRIGPPVLGHSRWAQAQLTIRPFRGLTVDNTYLLSSLRDISTNVNMFNAHVVRNKINYQFNRSMSLRVITQYNANITNTLLTALQDTRNINADFLFTYLPHPGTAIYVGYNSNAQNLDPTLTNTPDGLMRRSGYWLNDGRQIFIKVSYLFRY